MLGYDRQAVGWVHLLEDPLKMHSHVPNMQKCVCYGLSKKSLARLKCIKIFGDSGS